MSDHLTGNPCQTAPLLFNSPCVLCIWLLNGCFATLVCVLRRHKASVLGCTTADEEPSEGPLELELVAAGVGLPHPDKAYRGGEDAFFVSAKRRGAMGVADGVGGWSGEGVDPSLFSRWIWDWSASSCHGAAFLWASLVRRVDRILLLAPRIWVILTLRQTDPWCFAFS
jgi:hypothetical protein